MPNFHMNQKPGPALPLGKLGTQYSMGDVEKPVYSQLNRHRGPRLSPHLFSHLSPQALPLTFPCGWRGKGAPRALLCFARLIYRNVYSLTD